MFNDILREKAIESGITLTDDQIDKLRIYYELLVEWNEKMNLTALTEPEDVALKHFCDSILLLSYADVKEGSSLIDVGTGAGFPGLVLAICFPNLKVTLADSLNKRVKFLQEVIDALELENIEAIHGRAEDFAKPDKKREKYDLCVSRAVANMTTLSEYCLPFVKEGGRFISYKSEKITEEMENAKKAISLLGGKFDRSKDFYLPDSDIYRNLVVIKKAKETPKKFPRKAGLPSKEPLA